MTDKFGTTHLFVCLVFTGMLFLSFFGEAAFFHFPFCPYMNQTLFVLVTSWFLDVMYLIFIEQYSTLESLFAKCEVMCSKRNPA